jgi:hypothetical protein
VAIAKDRWLLPRALQGAGVVTEGSAKDADDPRRMDEDNRAPRAYRKVRHTLSMLKPRAPAPGLSCFF